MIGVVLEMCDICVMCTVHSVLHQPEEILSAVEFSVPGEAPFAETSFAVGTLDTADVPGSVEDVQ